MNDIDHDSEDTQYLFDVRLVAERLNLVPGLSNVDPAGKTHGGFTIRSESDRDYLIGMNAAVRRNPTPRQRELFHLAAQFVVTSIDERGNPTLARPADLDPEIDPLFVERAGLIAYLDARAKVRGQRS